MVWVAALVLCASIVASSDAYPRVDPGVHRALRTQAQVNVIVEMKHGPEIVLNRLHESVAVDRGSHIERMVEALERHSQRTQASVWPRDHRESSGRESNVKSFWITNSMLFEDASAELIAELAQNPAVKEIRGELVFEPLQITDWHEPLDVLEDTNASLPDVQPTWGVERVGAPKLWQDGLTGEGVVVGMIDSGVHIAHEALKHNFVSSHGWFDPESKSATPYDLTGHGSQVLAVAVGRHGVGVAPGAQWMACKSCRTADSCRESDLNECAQFMLCPTDPQGQNRDCSKAPHIINNSWGRKSTDGDRRVFEKHINAWHKASIIPVFANGNDRVCSSANFPGDYKDVIAVGNVLRFNAVAGTSSKGPSQTYPHLIKPDITAPGTSIRTVDFTTTNGYRSASGSSLAAPHVAGAMALLLSHDRSLTFDLMRQLLFSSANKDVHSTSESCGNVSDSVFPNNHFGHGIVDAHKALQDLKSKETPPCPF